MKEEMYKSLCDLIDETISEVEELKKSNRFSASEIKINDEDSKMGGQPTNGKLDAKAKKADDDDDDDDDDKDDKKDFGGDKKKDDDCDKAEGKNRESDPNGGHHQVVSKEDTEKADDDMDKEEAEKAEGTNRQADPNGGHHQPAYKSAAEIDDLQKSINESNDLIKSYVEGRIAPLEDKLTDMMTLMREIADAPVASKGASYKDVTPLKKSDEDEQVTQLSKAQVADKLLELKKSGTNVNSTDIASAELGSPVDLAKIVDKYNLN